jgi:hypothetical protein
MSWITRLSIAIVLCMPFAISAQVPRLTDAPIERAAISGKAQRISSYYSLNPDCAPRGDVEIRVTVAPSHGTTRIETGNDYPNYDRNNARYECDKQTVPVRSLYYTSAQGYTGPDTVTLQALYPDGTTYTYTFNIDVWAEKSVEAVVPAR